MPQVIVWAVVVLFAMLIAGAMRSGSGWVLLVLLAGAIHIGARYLNWRNTTYRITSQRLEYSGGVLSCTTAAMPLNRISNVTILRPFPWDLMCLGHFELDIPDQATRARNGVRPKVLLRCLPNLERLVT